MDPALDPHLPGNAYLGGLAASLDRADHQLIGTTDRAPCILPMRVLLSFGWTMRAAKHA